MAMICSLILCLLVSATVSFAEKDGGNTICRTFATDLKPCKRGRYKYDNLTLRYGNASAYELHNRIGGGAFGDVYIGQNTDTGQQVVVKTYHKLNKDKMNREIVISQEVCGGPHIAKLIDVLLFPGALYPALVLEYVHGIPYGELYSQLLPVDVQRYMFQFLMALHYAHSRYIIHYDIKPDNIMVDAANQDLNLIDWGLSRFVLPGNKINTAGTLHYKSPEMLVGYMKSNSSTDMWSFGCIMAEWVFRYQGAFFPGGFHSNQLDEISKVLGTRDLKRYLEKYDIESVSMHDLLLNIHHKKSHQPLLDMQFLNRFLPTPSHEKRSFESFVDAHNSEYATSDAIDLLGKILRYDHKERLTAYAAMQHPYFDAVRSEQINRHRFRHRR